MENKKIILISAVVVLLVVGAYLSFKGDSTQSEEPAAVTDQQVSADDPIDIVLDFYQPWLKAVQSDATDPYQEGFANAPILSAGLKTELAVAQENQEIDPVLCQNPIPEKIASKTLYEFDNKAQVLVLSRDQELAGQAIVTLLRLTDGWYIDSILCSRGEFGEEREFSFEYEGFLLKNIPPPHDPDFWHLVYEQEGVSGYAAQLFFDPESICVELNSDEAVCNPDQFTPVKKVKLQGEMSEYGVEVKRLTFIE